MYNRQKFIELSIKNHKVLYDYSKVEFKKTKDRVCIIDPDYGEFYQRANLHMKGADHPIRGKEKSSKFRRCTLSKFIEKAKKTHGNLYDYSKSIYINAVTKLCIIDPDYGEFWMTPNCHLLGQGHPKRGSKKASEKRRLSIDEFIKRSKEKHGEKYNYSKVNYINIDTKVCIIHPTLGEFWQSPYEHMKGANHPREIKNNIEIDHIIPLSIVFSGNIKSLRKNSFEINRPLVQFLLSNINEKKLSRFDNRTKSDFVIYGNKKIKAASIRNLYDIINKLCFEHLNIDISDIIENDKKYITNYFST